MPLQRHTSPGHPRRAAPPAGRPPAGAVSRLSSGPPVLPPDSLPPRLHVPLAAVRWGFRAPPNHAVDSQASARVSSRCATLGTGPGALCSAGAALMTQCVRPPRGGPTGEPHLTRVTFAPLFPSQTRRRRFVPPETACVQEPGVSTRDEEEETEVPGGSSGLSLNIFAYMKSCLLPLLQTVELAVGSSPLALTLRILKERLYELMHFISHGFKLT
uniref:uncharacterized protein LOC118525750 isoform X2 n=1 Tax=Halichoerus grypus TaxID=9711 RepID=UPI001659A957|nr:uncharacterized protein LOC118525750 isoform X2 [Halichoerus grypus]